MTNFRAFKCIICLIRLDGIIPLRNHRGGCLKITRIDGFRKISVNAFSFSTQFVSPQSKEGVRGYYKMIQEQNGEWLLQVYSTLAFDMSH